MKIKVLFTIAIVLYCGVVFPENLDLADLPASDIEISHCSAPVKPVCAIPKKSTPAPKKAVQDLRKSNEGITVSVQTQEVFAAEKEKDKEKQDSKEFDWNELIKNVIWPLLIFVLVLTFRKAILSLFSRILRVKHGETELEFIGKRANESLAKIAHGDHFGELGIKAIFDSVKLNEWATLVIARMLMRKGLTDLVSDGEFGPSPSLDKLLTKCRDGNYLPVGQIDELEKLREVTFFAEWWSGRVPTKGDWKWALSNCQRIVEELFDSEPVA